MRRLLVTIATLACITSPHPNQAMAWHDATHMAVAKAAGLDNYAYLAVGADMAKEKAGELEGLNHYYNTPKGVVITPAMVLDQFKKYNKPRDYNNPEDAKGHLYGAIVASINDYIIRESGGKYALYPLGYAMHYIGDLSMPFHNIAYDQFNMANHSANDGIVEITGPADEATDVKVARLAGEIRKRMNELPPLELSKNVNNFYKELAFNIAEIANKSAEIGYSMRDANPQMTRMTEDEAYKRLAYSARLLKAVYKATMK
jgi:hypothetical protein